MNGLEQTYWELHAKEILKDKGITNVELAKRLDILPQNVRKWVETKNIVNLSRISEVIGVDLNYLLYGNGNEDTSINGYIEVNNKIYKIKCKEDINALLEVINNLENTTSPR